MKRDVVCCDTFDGFPADSAKSEKVMCPTALRVCVDEVKSNFYKYGVSSQGVYFIVGKVQNTLCEIKAQRIAILRIDVDLYDATKSCLEQLWPKMSKGGIVIVDDYGVDYYGCRRAVDDFRYFNTDCGPINWIDTDGIWWEKL